jgi:hypothetical protein
MSNRIARLPIGYLYRLVEAEQEARRVSGRPALHPFTRLPVRPLVRLLLAVYWARN